MRVIRVSVDTTLPNFTKHFSTLPNFIGTSLGLSDLRNFFHLWIYLTGYSALLALSWSIIPYVPYLCYSFCPLYWSLTYWLSLSLCPLGPTSVSFLPTFCLLFQLSLSNSLSLFFLSLLFCLCCSWCLFICDIQCWYLAPIVFSLIIQVGATGPFDGYCLSCLFKEVLCLLTTLISKTALMKSG